MLRHKRRETEVFSVSFMDCICCGFGAVLLIFILTTGQKSSFSEFDMIKLRERISQLEKEIEIEKTEVDRLSKSLVTTNVDLQDIRERNAREQLRLTEREKQMQLLLSQLASLKDMLAKLLDDQKELVTQEEKTAIPIPNTDRRQYLTGIRLEGEFILFLVRASGSMLDETVDAAAMRLMDPDDKKREAPKWQRTLRALEWMIATLGPETHFYIMFFNDEAVSVLPDRPDQWINPTDQFLISEVLKNIRDVVPRGPANFERAFTQVRRLQRLPDSIVLFTDGLPTQSDTIPYQGDVDDNMRIRFWHAARRQIPPRTPVSTILFPMSGDPAAPAYFWELAGTTRGALVSPSKHWPDT